MSGRRPPIRAFTRSPRSRFAGEWDGQLHLDAGPLHCGRSRGESRNVECASSNGVQRGRRQRLSRIHGPDGAQRVGRRRTARLRRRRRYASALSASCRSSARQVTPVEASSSIAIRAGCDRSHVRPQLDRALPLRGRRPVSILCRSGRGIRRRRPLTILADGKAVTPPSSTNTCLTFGRLRADGARGFIPPVADQRQWNEPRKRRPR
jgi:hypothetical protein